MQKYNLSDCSIVIPIFIDSEERLEHLTFALTYFNRYFLNHQLIVLEQGAQSKTQCLPKTGARVEFIKSDETFTSAKVANMAVDMVDTPFFSKFDVDVFIHPKAIFDAFERLKNNAKTSLILPFNGVSFTIQNPLRKQLMESFDFERLPLVSKKNAQKCSFESMYLKNDNSTGLVHHFRTSVYKEFGGYNEELLGWGFEDDEVLARYEKLNCPAEFLENYTAFHFDHPRMPSNPIQAFKNYYRSLVIKNMSCEDVLDYIKIWNRFVP